MKSMELEEDKMKIAVLSGKGGTGKTLVSVSLATVAPKAVYLDCDVEEPNGHLFLKPSNIETRKVFVKIPVVNNEICNGCQKCVEFCKFNALAYVKNKLMVFHDTCHSCGGCVLFCPMKALSEKERAIGEVQKGTSDNITVITGILNTGEASGIPIINNLLKDTSIKNNLTIIDCPPGSDCIAMESIRDADYCILVAEPTIFGVHNLKMVYDLVKLFKKPFGVVINKSFEGKNLVEEFCMENQIKVLTKIPFDKELGVLNSKGLIVTKENQKYNKLFSKLLHTVTKEVYHETTINP